MMGLVLNFLINFQWARVEIQEHTLRERNRTDHTGSGVRLSVLSLIFESACSSHIISTLSRVCSCSENW